VTLPILEFDSEREAMIEPGRLYPPEDVPEHCVICFFRDVIEQVVASHSAKIAIENHWEDGPHPIYEIAVEGRRLAFFHPGIGSAMASSILEEVIAFGCRKYIACGGCGVLEKAIGVGHLVVLTGAVRDEGASYHYLPPAREISAQPGPIAALTAVLDQKQLPYRLGKSWTTDAPYRETKTRIETRRQEGCVVVEMEASGLMAVAEYRGVDFGQIVYGGDDLSGETWDHRGWHTRTEIRESLFWLAVDACFRL
jgi:uridine phosphorylase